MVWTQESYRNSVKCDRPGECSPQKDCLRWHWLTFRQPEDSDRDFRSGCRNVSQCHLKQSFWGLHSPGRSPFTELWCFFVFYSLVLLPIIRLEKYSTTTAAKTWPLPRAVNIPPHDTAPPLKTISLKDTSHVTWTCDAPDAELVIPRTFRVDS